LNNILEKRPYSKIAWHQLGKIYAKLNMNAQAISAFDFAIISDDEFTSGYIEKGKVLEKEKKYNEAIENYKISIQLNEPNSFVIYRIGLCYIKLDNYKVGIKYLKKSIRIDATNESAWIELIDIYLKNDNLRQASYLINKAISSNQESNRIIKKSFEINYKMRFFTEAIKNIESLIELGDLKWSNWKNLLDCSVNTKNWDKTLKVALRAKKIFPKKTYIDYLISGCLIKLGKKNEAIYFFQSAKKIKEIPNKLVKNFPELVNEDIFLS
jgi:tetratricopeptide (TPR) repeat protein